METHDRGFGGDPWLGRESGGDLRPGHKLGRESGGNLLPGHRCGGDPQPGQGSRGDRRLWPSSRRDP